MTFDRPWLLLVLPVAAALTIAVQRAGLSGIGARQRRVALGIRLGLLSLLILALAGMRVGVGGDRVAVVFVVDRSASVGPGGGSQALEAIDEALENKRRGDLAAVVAFGREPRLEFSMTDLPELQALTALPDASATDLARALRLAGALFPEGSKRRIVVLSDGRETDGDARREAEALARAGIRIDTIALTATAGPDSLIEGIDAPGRVRIGEGYRLGVTIRSPGGPVHLDVTRDGRPLVSRDLVVREGLTTIPVDDRALEPGVRRYEARLTSTIDPVTENDRGSAAVVVEGPPRVLLVEGEPGEAAALARALRAARLTVDVVTPFELPDLGTLLEYESTLLVDVPARMLSPEQVAILGAAVRDAGAGLMTIGGEDSYGIGGYRGTELEALLPVDAELTDPERRPSIAEALVIDTSGSMGYEGGVNKTDLSRAGASRAISSLTNEDVVGVLAFNTTSRWVLPLQRFPSDDEVKAALRKLQPNGGTDIAQAIRAAMTGLEDTDAKLKHMILFTDGISDDRFLVRLASEANAKGITLSVIAIGVETGAILPQVARAGGGRFYAVRNLTEAPQVLVDETLLASRNFINEGSYRPVIAANTPLTETLRATPPLLGYVATSPKATATVELVIGDEKDPLLASWRAGLGSVASWTSDAKARWSRAWVDWPGFRDFWANAVRSTFPPAGTGAFGVEAIVDGPLLRIELRSDRPVGGDVAAVARVVGPSLASIEITLERTGPASFGGTVPVADEGTYLVLPSVSIDGAPVYRGHATATVSYPAEYLATGPDQQLLADLARIGGGRARVSPERVFDAAGLRPSPARREVWPFLAVLCAFLLPIDIAARRLIVSREDLRALTKRLRRPRRAEPGTPSEPERDARVERLIRAKDRARDRSG